jgi:hypothetical protein
MKKIIIIASVVTILFATPLYLGEKIKKDVHLNIEQLNKMPGYNAAVTEYSRGWLRSNAKINIAYDVAALQGAASGSFDDESAARMLAVMGEGITFVMDVRHGLIDFKTLPALPMADIYITLDESNAEAIQPVLDNLEQKYSVQELFVIDALIPLLGKGVFNVTIPAMSSYVDSTAFKFAGLKTNGTFSSNGKRYDFSGAFGEIEIDSPEFSFNTSDIIIVGKGAMSDNFWMSYGASTMRMESLSFTTANTKADAVAFSLQDFVINTDLKPSGEDMLSMLMDLDIAKLNIPGYTVSNIDYDWSLENLRESTLKAVYDQMDQLQGKVDDSPQEVIEAMKVLAKDFVSAGPVLNIDKLGYTIDEVNYLSVEGGITVDASIAEQAIDAENPMAILAGLSGKMTMEFGEQLFQFAMKENIKKQLAGMDMSPEQQAQVMAEQSKNIIQMSKQLVEQGMLKKVNNGYSVDITYQDSVPLINGNPLSMF